MVKSIYKITNKINNKSYIGQTNNINRRFQEHKVQKNDSDGTSKLLHQAIKKYGLENFDFEVLEENIENYDAREQYWIAYYHTLSDEHGYNLTPGGSSPPILKGANNPNTTHDISQVQEVIRLLRDTQLSSKEIGKCTGYDDSAIIRINKGIMWHDDSLIYPIRKELTLDFNQDRALNIIYDLKYTKLTQKEIANKYGVGRTTVTAINNGKNNRQPNLNYPIRDKKTDRHSKTILMIDPKTGEVIDEFTTAAEASQFVKVSRSAIQSCCSGNTKTSGGYCWRYKDE